MQASGSTSGRVKKGFNMSTPWRQCSLLALRILHARHALSACNPLHHVEFHRTIFSPPSPSRFVVWEHHSLIRSVGLGLSGDGKSHEFCSFAATEMDMDSDVADVTDMPDIFNLSKADLNASYQFLRSLGLKKDKLSKLVSKCPAVLCRTFEDGMVSLTQSLTAIGLPDHLACRILEKNPNLVRRILKRNLFVENLTYLTDCGLNAKQLERVVRIYPQCLGASKELQLKPTVEFLIKLGVTKEKLGKVISLSPYYLGYRHAISLMPKVVYLIKVGVKEEHLGKLIMEQPSILCLSVKENIMPKLSYLESVGVESDRVGEMISRCPAMLTSNMNTLKTKVEYLRKSGLTGKNLVSLLTLHPDLLGRSLKSLSLGFSNLRSMGFTEDEVCEILKRHPTALSSTVIHLRNKFDFLTKVMNRSEKEVLKFTAFVTYSLEKRIKPRHRVFTWLMSEGLLPQKNYSLRTIVGGSEEYFRNRFVGLHPAAEAMYKEHLLAANMAAETKLIELHEKNMIDLHGT